MEFDEMEASRYFAEEVPKTARAGIFHHESPWDFVCDMFLDLRNLLPPEADTSLAVVVRIFDSAWRPQHTSGDLAQIPATTTVKAVHW